MAEHDLSEKRKEYFLDFPQKNDTFFLKGSSGYDWGFRNRLARIFNPKSGKTVMLAIDHGYFQGPTTGLVRTRVTSIQIAHEARQTAARGENVAVRVGQPVRPRDRVFVVTPR